MATSYDLTFVIPMCSWIYTKWRFFFSVKHIQFIVKTRSRRHVSALQSHHQAFL